MTTRDDSQAHRQEVKAFTGPGRLHDGGGLYFYVNERGGRSWEYRFERNGKRKTMGLGGYPAVTLGKARELHKDAVALVAAGIDPIAARKADRQIAAASFTVMEACEAYITAHAGGLEDRALCRPDPRAAETYVKPVIGDMPIIGHSARRGQAGAGADLEQDTADREAIRQYLEGAVELGDRRRPSRRTRSTRSRSSG